VGGELSLNVLIFQEGGSWVAQVIEHDMAAHGDSPYAALSAVFLVIQTHVNFDTRHRRKPFSNLKPAPDVYRQALKNARPLTPPQFPQMPPALIHAAITNESVQAPPC